MSKVFKLLNEVRKDEEGATMVEYAILSRPHLGCRDRCDN